MLRLVERSALPYRAIFALAYGAGLEVSAILSLVDVDGEPLRHSFCAARADSAAARQLRALAGFFIAVDGHERGS